MLCNQLLFVNRKPEKIFSVKIFSIHLPIDFTSIVTSTTAKLSFIQIRFPNVHSPIDKLRVSQMKVMNVVGVGIMRDANFLVTIASEDVFPA